MLELKEKHSDLLDQIDLVVERDYDVNSLERIKSLFKLRDFLEYEINKNLIVIEHNEDILYRVTSIHQLMLHHVDLLLYNFINDESLVILKNRGTVRLTSAIMVAKLAEDGYTFPIGDHNVKKIQELYISRNDEMIGSMLLDFSTGVFSSFEVSIQKLFNKKVLKKIIKSLKLRYHNFIPVSIQINEVFNIPSIKNNLSCDDLEDYRNCIKIARLIRNTVHTLGVYKGRKMELYQIDGSSVTLKAGKGPITDNYCFYFSLCKKLVSIYCHLCELASMELLELEEYIPEE
ncbi:hypothetical protein RZ760_008560 [Providencia rettgeri]|nr:hypothetical protein [Providencia rettgeri]